MESQQVTSSTTAIGAIRPVSLKIRGLGHIPSKKNHHFPLQNGGLGLDAEIKERMERITRALLCELLSLCQTTGSVTQTGCSRLSSIASRMPVKDSWQWIPEITVSCKMVPKGEEGCDVTIETIYASES